MWGPFRSSKSSEEALRRLGGPDVDAERKKNAMTSNDKLLTVFWVCVALVLMFLTWRGFDYMLQVARLPQPELDSNAVRACMYQCVNTCIGATGSEK